MKTDWSGLLRSRISAVTRGTLTNTKISHRTFFKIRPRYKWYMRPTRLNTLLRWESDCCFIHRCIRSGISFRDVQQLHYLSLVQQHLILAFTCAATNTQRVSSSIHSHLLSTHFTAMDHSHKNKNDKRYRRLYVGESGVFWDRGILGQSTFRPFIVLLQ